MDIYFNDTLAARIPNQLFIDASDPECVGHDDARVCLEELQDSIEEACDGRQLFFLLPAPSDGRCDSVLRWVLKLLGGDETLTSKRT